jgi:hypothetical protein
VPSSHMKNREVLLNARLNGVAVGSRENLILGLRTYASVIKADALKISSVLL